MPSSSARPRFRFHLASKFFALLGLLMVTTLGIGVTAVFGLSQTQADTERLYTDHLLTSQLTTALGKSLDDAAETSLQLVPTTDPARIRLLDARLDNRIVPGVTRGIEALQRTHAHDAAGERRPVERIAAGWETFLDLRRSGSLVRTCCGPSLVTFDNDLVQRIAAIFDPLDAVIDRLDAVEFDLARQDRAHSVDTYQKTRLLILGIIAAALACGVGAVILLLRNVVPRVRDYSLLASEVAAGTAGRRLVVRGGDEIADLGHTLNRMIERQNAQAFSEGAQMEFAAMMQLAESENEANDLLKRHVERSIAGSTAAVLNRNNSEDRLEARTNLPDESPLRAALIGAKPRSCLAVRFGRTHHEAKDGKPLVTCDVCAGMSEHSTCEPLLVGGDVIGSLLVNHEQVLPDSERQAIDLSVTQAAPVLGNLRNLALAETRAATDSLTGLANARASHDTLKRMVAQAFRTGAPLTAILLDLDHFKQINDRFGHARGDDVLATVGAVLDATARESDFVGRLGGEEFLLLLPNTGGSDNLVVAEKIRHVVSEVTVPGVDRLITASLGVAVYPDDATDPETLLRHADRALYTAKANGRNRVEASFPAGLLDEGMPAQALDGHLG
jgi:diguanylate cyclase (GGDEF)-like protein